MFTVSATGCFANDSTCTCWRRISRAVFRNTFTVRGIVRAGPVHTITGRTSTDKALIFTLVSRIHIIRFISLAVGDSVIAVTIPQKTNSSNLIGLFGKGRRCRFRDRCVCMCVFKYSVIVWGEQSQIHGRYRRDKS